MEFRSPEGVWRADRLSEVPAVCREAERAAADGLYAVGFISYEAAPAFDPALVVRDGCPLPLAWFGVFSGFAPAAVRAPVNVARLAWKPSDSRDAYDAAIRRIKELISAGDTYQVNHTLRLRAPFAGDAAALFRSLCEAQRASYSMLLDLGDHALCSVSPELFFRLEGEDITCKPMKGTRARGRTTAEDAELAAALRDSAKERAENVMIVDMMRSDLGRIARTGSVAVKSLFDVERYDTLFQMTSTVAAKTDAPIADILTALFPSASVTGAPKVRTMQIISELESSPRGIYTGCMGVIGPGRRAAFNVAIRTAHVRRAEGVVEYGTGGGITWDSRTDAEHHECLAKAAVLTCDCRPFSLLETIRWDPGSGYVLLDLHLRRLLDSAAYFGFPANGDAVRAALETRAAAFGPAPRRVRLLLSAAGDISLEDADLPADGGRTWSIALADEPVDPSDRLLFHKTTRRDVYDDARAAHPEADDVILWSARGEVTESTIANVVARIGGELVTPPVSCGLLAGVQRAALLADGVIGERIIAPRDLAEAEEIFLINSVRGWIRAQLASAPRAAGRRWPPRPATTTGVPRPGQLSPARSRAGDVPK